MNGPRAALVLALGAGLVLLASRAWSAMRDAAPETQGAPLDLSGWGFDSSAWSTPAFDFAWFTGGAAGESLAAVSQGAVMMYAPRWTLPASGEPYRSLIEQAEDRHGLPRMMLGRVLWQESRFRPDIIDGSTRSPAGAVGIAQFMPATAAELGVDPLNVAQSIDAAGRYLAWLYRSLGSWDRALAGYNWGIGNVQRKGLAAAPNETKNYVLAVMGDLGYA